MNVIAPEEYEGELGDPMPPEYQEFRDAQGIPVHTGLAIDDINELETAEWDLTGQRGAFVNLYGMQGLDDIQIHEIEPNGETARQRHFYEEVVYVTEGNGITVIGEGDDEVTFEWGEEACFLIPKNVTYKHINASGDSPVRLVSQTQLPQLMSMVKDNDFFFECDYAFGSSAIDEDFYSATGREGTMYDGKYGDEGAMTWEANFIPDVTKFDNLRTWNRLGATKIVFIPFPTSSMFVHLTEWSAGTYKNAHRHGPGANVFIRSGEGYSLLWREGWEDRIKVDWSVHSLVTPPAGWYHQHFNTGAEPAGQLAIHGPRVGTLHEHGVFDAHDVLNIIDYVDEDPDVRRLYQEELDQRGLEFGMPEEAYTDPTYDFEAAET